MGAVLQHRIAKNRDTIPILFRRQVLVPDYKDNVIQECLVQGCGVIVTDGLRKIDPVYFGAEGGVQATNIQQAEAPAVVYLCINVWLNGLLGKRSGLADRLAQWL